MNNIRNLVKERKPLRVIYVASYIPRKCGIATYTKDLTNAINMLNPYGLAEIMAMHRDSEEFNYPWEVKYKIEEQDLGSYIRAAEYVNSSSADLVVLEHEFGLFGGRCGEYVLHFAEQIKSPLVVTCHTIIDDPESDYGQTFLRLAKRADVLVVMMEESAEKLIAKYKIDEKKIMVIPHGTPDLPYASTEFYKKKKRIGTCRLVMGNINLLSENKGIEYAIEAVEQIAKKIPDVLYVVVGQTHPGVRERDGEVYRNKLKKMVRDKGLTKNVRFVNEYLNLKDLLDWLKTMDIYVTPYLDPQQSSSGALAYAIGAGKLCISTPYLYAKEVLKDNRGILVPFRDSKSIAQAVTSLWLGNGRREEIQKRAYDYGRLMTWSNVALRHLDLFSEVVKKS